MFEKKELLFLAHSDNALGPMTEDAQKRASMQDWRSFPYFLTAEVWSSLCSAQCSQLKKVDALVKHLVFMGLRNPSEMTQGLIAAVIGRHELDDSRFAALLATVKSVSKTHTVRARQSGLAYPAGLRLDILPQLPEQLPEDFVRHVAPHGFAEIPEGVDIEAIQQVARSCGVRSTHRTRVLSQQMVRGDPTASFGGPMASGFAQGFMSAMMHGASLAAREDGGLRNLQFLNREAAPATSRRQDDLARLLNGATDRDVAKSSEVPQGQQLALVAPAQCSQTEVAKNMSTAEAVDAKVKESSAGSRMPESVEIVEQKPNDPKVATVLDTEQGAPAKAETSVAAGVAMLAEAHYQKELESDPAQQPVKKRGRPPQNGPVTGMKRPASCVEPQVSAVAPQDGSKKNSAEKKGPGQSGTTAALKRPAGCLTKTTKGKTTKGKVGRPAKCSKQTKEVAATTVEQPDKKKPLTHAMRCAMKPKGCATCRHTVGCCPSCWRKRGYIKLVDWEAEHWSILGFFWRNKKGSLFGSLFKCSSCERFFFRKTFVFLGVGSSFAT